MSFPARSKVNDNAQQKDHHMTLFALEAALKLARDRGAEDNALVRFDVVSDKSDDAGASLRVDDELGSAELERDGRQEIVLR